MKVIKYAAATMVLLLSSCAIHTQSGQTAVAKKPHNAVMVLQLSDGSKINQTFPIRFPPFEEYSGKEVTSTFDVEISDRGALVLLDEPTDEEEDLVSKFRDAVSTQPFQQHVGKRGFVVISFRIFSEANTASLLHKAQLFEDEGMNEQALALISEIDEDDQKTVPVLVLKGEILANLDGLEQSVKLYSEAIERSPENERIYYARAYRWKKLGKLDKALDDLRQSLKLNDSHWETYDLLASTSEAAGRTLDAIKYSTLGLSVRKDYHFYNKRGWLYQQNESPKLALADFRKAHDLSPNNTSVLSGLARVHYELDELNESLRLVDKALSLEGNNRFDLHLRALVLEALNRFDEAMQCYRIVIDDLTPNSASFNNLGWLHMRQGNYEQAITLFNTQVERGLSSEHQRNNLATAYFLVGDYQRAIDAFNVAIANADDNPSFSHAGKARTYTKLGDLEKAMESLAQVIKGDRDYFDAFYQMAYGEEGNHLSIILSELMDLAKAQNDTESQRLITKWRTLE